MTAGYYHSPELPWSPSPAEQRRFRIITTAVLLGYILISAVSVLTKVPPVDRSEAENLPPRLAKLVIQEKPKAPPPPPPVEEKKPEAEKKVEEPKPEQRKETVPNAAEAARKKAARSGLLALSGELASLQQHDLGKLMQDSPLTKTNGGDQNNYRNDAANRSIITSQAVKGSGGINTSRLNRDLGQASLAARATTTVESPTLEAEQQTSAGQDGRRAGRSTEQIQLILDRSKGALYTLYHRALRANPALQGKVVLEITIAPTGEVTDCKVVSAELDDAELITKLVARIRLLDFSAKDVETTVFTWPIDFLPSS